MEKAGIKFLYSEDFKEMLQNAREAARKFTFHESRRETMEGMATFAVVACPENRFWLDADITSEEEWITHLEDEDELDDQLREEISKVGLQFNLVILGEIDGMEEFMGSMSLGAGEMYEDQVLRTIREAYDTHMQWVLEDALG